MTILDKFNFSYSTYDTYCKSQLWFYFMKIAKSPESDKGIQVYGDAGNVVHKAAQDWWETKEKTFDKHWNNYGIDGQDGINGATLSYDNFFKMYMRAIDYMQKIECQNHRTEMKFEHRFESLGMNFKGFIDLCTTEGEDFVFYDWKTNSSHTRKTHRKQRLIYSWLSWRVSKTIPICRWVYLKDMDIIEEKFTPDELEEFEIELCNFRTDILEKDEDISKYEAGNYKNPFNKHYSLCKQEVEKRQNSASLELHMSIRGNYVFFDGDVNTKLLEGIDFRTKFDLPDKYFMQEAVKKKAKGKINLQDIGTVHLYNHKFKCFPIGLLNVVKDIIHEFEEHYGKKIKVIVVDKRDKKVMEKKLGIMPDKLKGFE